MRADMPGGPCRERRARREVSQFRWPSKKRHREGRSAAPAGLIGSARRAIPRSCDQTMTSAGICLALLLVLAPCACLGQAAEQKPSPIDAADRLFRAGEFAEAREQYARSAADHPDDYSAILQLGRIALLSNRLDDARN